MGDSDLVSRKADLLEAEVDGDIVGLDVAAGACFGFNSTATRVWQLIEQPTSLADICDRLTQEFDVDGDTCRREIGALIDQMAGSGLVKVEQAAR